MVTTDKKELDSLLANLVRMWITHDLSNMRVINWWRKFYYAVNYALSDPPRSVCPQFITWGTAAVKLWQLRGVICQKLVICGCPADVDQAVAVAPCLTVPKTRASVTHSTSSEMSSALTAFYSFTKFTSYFLFLSLSLQRSHDVSQPVWQKAVMSAYRFILVFAAGGEWGLSSVGWVSIAVRTVREQDRQRERQRGSDLKLWRPPIWMAQIFRNHSGISY